MDKQRDFEKGWEEYKAKRKQEIEEMAKVLCINDNFVCETCPSENECFNYKHAKQLYDAGYSKIPENAVVLTREEYEKLKLFEERVRSGVCFTQKEWFDYCQKDSNERTSLLIKAKKDTRKETSEKFAEMAKNKAIRQQEFVGELAIGVIEYVKVKDIDEICKEITDKGVQNGN